MARVTGIEPRPERLMEFEAKVNHLFQGEDALAIPLQHLIARFSAPEVLLEIRFALTPQWLTTRSSAITLTTFLRTSI